MSSTETLYNWMAMSGIKLNCIKMKVILYQLSVAKMTSKRTSDSTCATPPSKKAKLCTNSPNRNYKDSWKIGHSWLRYDAKQKLMFCDVCIRVQKSNSFTTGCYVFKRESVTKHASSKEHVAATSATQQSVDMDVARKAALSKSETAVTSAMKNVYFAAKQDLPNAVVPALNMLCIEQGASQLCDLKVDSHTTYAHNQSVSDFQDAITQVLHDELLTKVNKSVKYSLMLDESTDISIHQNLIVYIRLLERDAMGTVIPQTHFLGISDLNRANAECIYTKVVELLGEKGITLSNLCGVSTDGAAVMVGNRSGVVTRMKSSVPGVLSTHCIAHRLALSCCGGADTIPYLVKFLEILNSIYKYFHFSPKNMATLASIQSILQAQPKRFREVFHTRCLSFEGSVDALISSYGSLVSVFLEENTGKSLSMHKPITTYKFLYTAHFLSDALKPLAILSKMYRKSDLDYSEVSPLLTSTITKLEELRDDKDGVNLTKFQSVAPTNPQVGPDGLVTFEFEGHTIKDSDKQRQESVSVCDKFVNSMVKNLNERFSDNEDGAVLTAFSNVFNPQLPAISVKDDVEVVSEYLGTVGMGGYREELASFVEYARTSHDSENKSVSTTRDVANLAIRHKDSFPAAAEAAERLLVLPVSTADCERGFSKQNLIKTALRNSLTSNSLEKLMSIGINGPELQKFNFKAAFTAWASRKSRRILNLN